MSRKVDGVTLPVTTGEMMASFVLACLFGLAGLPAVLESKDIIPLVLTQIFSVKYGFRLFTIGTISIMAIGWLSLFLILWNKLEKAETYKQRFLITLKWSAIAIGAFLVLILGHALFDVIMAG